MAEIYIFFSVSPEIPFKAGELHENPEEVSLGGEQKALVYSET